MKAPKIQKTQKSSRRKTANAYDRALSKLLIALSILIGYGLITYFFFFTMAAPLADSKTLFKWFFRAWLLLGILILIHVWKKLTKAFTTRSIHR